MEEENVSSADQPELDKSLAWEKAVIDKVNGFAFASGVDLQAYPNAMRSYEDLVGSGAESDSVSFKDKRFPQFLFL